MKKVFIGVFLSSIAALSVAASATEYPSLPITFANLSRAIVPASNNLFKKISAHAASSEKKKKSLPKATRFDLEWQNESWHFLLNPNPPGSGLLLEVYSGQLVDLTFTNFSVWDQDDEASFDIDGIKATVNGKPSDGIHIWLPNAGDQAQAEFTAPTPGIYLIYSNYSGTAGPIGQLIVLKAPKN